MKKSVTIIAEAGVNHNGQIDLAHKLIDAAADTGADVVKFQTFRADTLATPDAPKCDYQLQTTDADESQFTMLRKLELPLDAYPALIEHCAHRGVEFMSTPFDEQSAQFLANLGIRRMKLPSGEVTNLPFLEMVSGLGLPVILSTGMATLEEVSDAVACLRKSGCIDLTVLHCLTNYPAAVEETNLRAMVTMGQAFSVPVGYSDHTEGISVSLAAVAMGATVIEKHFTLDRGMEGPDHLASLEPAGFKALVEGVHEVFAALGHGRKEPAPSEMGNRMIVRRSLTASQNIAAGTVITREMLIARRPATGISPSRLQDVVGRRAVSNIAAGTVLQTTMVAGME